MNILVTSAGRRTALVRAFQVAAHRRGGDVIAADTDGLAPALQVADISVRLPRATVPEYPAALTRVVEEFGVRLIVPTIDTELSVLADLAPALGALNCVSLISAQDLLAIAGDKYSTVREFGAHGIRVPDSWLPSQLSECVLPDRLFVKPRNGSASQHTYAVDAADLPNVLHRVPNPIVQEQIEGREVTIDALLDLHGRPLHYVPRLRIRTVGGESIQGVTLPADDLTDWVRQLLGIVSSHGGRGPMTLQGFLTPDGPVFSEINPRFGGGFPLALAAGADYPEWLLRMVEGQDVEPSFGSYQVGLYMTRAYADSFITSPKWT